MGIIGENVGDVLSTIFEAGRSISVEHISDQMIIMKQLLCEKLVPRATKMSVTFSCS